MSNRRNVMAAIPESQRAKEMKRLDLGKALWRKYSVWNDEGQTTHQKNSLNCLLHLQPSWNPEPCGVVCKENSKRSVQERTQL